MKKVIEAISLVKKYDRFTAVNELNFHVTDGECFGLLGPMALARPIHLKLFMEVQKYLGRIVSTRPEC